MNNFLKNGGVLPHGLLGHNSEDFFRGFNRTYQNTPLRIGMISATYPVSDKKNLSKLTTEYDVVVIQQDGNKGIASVTYKNCMSAEGLGGIGDFLEKTLRQKNSNTTKNNSVDFKGQDGAIVLILCLDGMSEKAIIVGSMTHPDRKTKLTDTGPRLEGEFNGVHIKVDKDGSTSLQFKGATDSKGTPTDSSQGTTTVKIEKDGSFQVDHTGVTFRMEKGGTASITAKKDITLNAQGNINIVAKGDVNVQCTNAKVNASAQVDVKSPKIKLNGTSSGITTANSHQGVVDFITGVPVQPSETTTGDV